MTLPIIQGSALKALEGEDAMSWETKLLRAGEALDSYIPEPERAIDKPFIDANRRRILNLWSWYCCNWSC